MARTKPVFNGFKDRTEAGKKLGRRLQRSFTPSSLDQKPIVLGLPRGGIPLAREIARALRAPWDFLGVKKIGAPGNPEFAVGAVSEGHLTIFNDTTIERFDLDRDEIEKIAKTKLDELETQISKFRRHKHQLDVAGRDVIVADDGIATGATFEAAILALRARGAHRISIVAPVGSEQARERLEELADEVLILSTPHTFWSVGAWYENFAQVEDEEVIALLTEDADEPAQPRPNRTTRAKRPPGRTDHGRMGIDETLSQHAKLLSSRDQLEQLASQLAGSRIVMLGESTHGTHEFYSLRSRLSRILMERHGFNFVAVEGDWPDCHRLHRYARGGAGASAMEVAKSFRRWPTWMWANREVTDLIEWMRSYSEAQSPVGFFGLDVYSLFESIDAIRSYSARLNPSLASDLVKRLRCFEPFDRNEFSYAQSLARLPTGCHQEVTSNLRDLLAVRLQDTSLSGAELFDVQQNARVIANAEKYYRSMLSGDVDSWNIRDRHMLETLEMLLERHGPSSKAIVWAHNTHIGDYRATDMIDEGYVNLGGLAREAFGPERVELVGFGTHSGRVLASRAWGGREEIMLLPEARAESWESHFHRACVAQKAPQLVLSFTENDVAEVFRATRGHRAVGVVYSPAFEHRGHNYVPTSLSDRYDAFVFVDKTTGLRSLHTDAAKGLVPETWPMGQ